MPQQIVYTDEKEDEIVKQFQEKWQVSKAQTIKLMILSFGENKKR